MEILVTAFEPFLLNEINSSERVLESIKNLSLGVKLNELMLPVTYGKSHIILKRSSKRFKP